MDITSKLKQAVLGNYLLKIIQISGSLLIIPIMFSELGAEVVGIWYLIIQVSMFVGLLDFGFSPTITRQLSISLHSSRNLKDVVEYLSTSKKVLARVSVFSFLLVNAVGFLYLNLLGYVWNEAVEVYVSWFVLTFSISLSIRYLYIASLMLATGQVGRVAYIYSVVAALNILLKIFALKSGWGLLGLVAIEAAGKAVTIIIIRIYMPYKAKVILGNSSDFSKSAFNKMAKPALLSWLTALGMFLSNRFDLFIIGAYVSTEAVGKYQAVYTVLHNISQLATILTASSVVFISQKWAAGKLNDIKSMLTRNMHFALTIVGLSSVFLLLYGEKVFGLWIGPENFIGMPVVWLLILIYLIFNHDFILKRILRATEYEKFYVVSLVSGVLNIGLSIFLVQHYGVVGVVVATLCTTTVANAVFSMIHGKKRLGLGYLEHLGKNLALPVLICCVYTSFLLLIDALAIDPGATWSSFLPHVSFSILFFGLFFMISRKVRMT